MDRFPALFADLQGAYAAGRYEEALRLARCLLVLAPDRSDALNAVGVTLGEQGHVHQALSMFQRIRRLMPRAPVAGNLANCLRQLGRHAEAMDAYAEALRRTPADTVLLSWVVGSLTALGRRDDAIGVARRIACLTPDAAGAWRNLGLLLRDTGRGGAAQPAFERALALAPDQEHRRLAIYNNRALLARNHLRGQGIEIGAFCNPLQVPEGVTVRYVDAYDTAELYRRFPEHADRTLVPVDVVDNGETLASFAPASEDFIIANHMLEHCEDPIGTLANMLRVLRPGGILFLTVPDKRFTFDELRPLTSVEHLRRDHAEGPQGSRLAHFHEWARLVQKVAEDEVEAAVAALHQTPTQLHYHVWTHETFVDFLTRVRQDCGLPFTLVDSRPSGRYESAAILRRTA